jgi:hypothetical protein
MMARKKEQEVFLLGAVPCQVAGETATDSIFKNRLGAQCWWLTPVIPATWESEFGRITVSGQPRQIVLETPISTITRAKWTRDWLNSRVPALQV